MNNLPRYFVPFICLIVLFYFVLCIISRDIVYGFLIIADYLTTLLVGYYILDRHLDTFLSEKETILSNYGITGENRVRHDYLFPSVCGFMIGIGILLTLFFVFLIWINSLHQPTDILTKSIKFLTSQIIMAGSVYIFSALTHKVIIDIFTRDVKIIFQRYFSDVSGR